MDHINFVLTVTFGVVSSVIGFMFDVPHAVILAIIGGASMGVAIKRPVGLIEGASIVLGVTVALGWILPAVTSNPTTLKAAGVITAFIVSAGRHLIPNGVDQVWNAGIDELIGVIKTAGAEFKRRIGAKDAAKQEPNE